MRGKRDRAGRGGFPAGTSAGLAVAPLPSCRLQIALAGVLLTGLFAALVWRLYVIQVAGHAATVERVRRMTSAVERRPGRRGRILSRRGDEAPWAVEVPGFTLAIDPGLYAPGDRGEVARIASDAAGISPERRRRLLERLESARESGGALRYLPIRKGLEPEAARRLAGDLRGLLGEDGMRGVILEETHARRYPKGSLLGSVLGWTGTGATSAEIAGASGLELALDPYLESFDGRRIVLKDGTQRTRFLWTDDIDVAPRDGFDVVLTIDSRIQRIVEEELEKGVLAKRAEAGLAVVLECSDGDVLAMASYPSLDPGLVGVYPREELARRRANRVIERQYEPGSTIKPFWAAGAIEAGVFTASDPVWKGGKEARLLGRRVRDVSDHGPMDFEDGVVFSSNIAMAIVGLRLGKERMNAILDRFHFQERTGILLPGEAVGRRTPLSRWKDRYTTISAAFGYELSVTPIQLAAAYVSLVNGGRYFAPRLVDRIQRGDEVYTLPVRERGRSISERTSREMRRILRRVVTDGTGRRQGLAALPFGGKSGTAAISKGKRGYGAGGKEYLASFVAYAPHPDPEIVVLVMIEKPRKGLYYGAAVSGPVVRNILRRVFRVPGDAVARAR